MEQIVEWVRQYSMVVLLMTVLVSATAKKEYRKYIRLFVEIIFVITLVNPILQVFGQSEQLFENISYDSFWQGLEGIKMDREKMDFLNEDYYTAYYEKAIEADIKLLAENSGYEVIRAEVDLNEEFEAESIALTVAKQSTENVIIGTLEEKPESEELAALREKVSEYYKIDAEKITIVD